jgi:hypothetical protein
VLAASLVSVLPILPIVYYSSLPSLANALIGAAVYLGAYLTVAPLFRAVKRADLQTLIPILGQIRILRLATRLIFAYEAQVLNIVEPQAKPTVSSGNPT